jgi:hypothetical protein
MKYWVRIDKKSFGPFSPDQLRHVPGVSPDSFVCPEGARSASDWHRLRDMPELARAAPSGAHAASASPPPPAPAPVAPTSLPPVSAAGHGLGLKIAALSLLGATAGGVAVAAHFHAQARAAEAARQTAARAEARQLAQRKAAQARATQEAAAKRVKEQALARAAEAAQREAARKKAAQHYSHQEIGMTKQNDQAFISVLERIAPKFPKVYRLDAAGLGQVFNESGAMSGHPVPGYRALMVSAMHSHMSQFADMDPEAGREISRKRVGDHWMIQVYWPKPVNSYAPVLLREAVVRSWVDFPPRRFLWIVGVYSGETVELANAYGEHARVPVIDLVEVLGENPEPNSIHGYDASDQFVYTYDYTMIGKL